MKLFVLAAVSVLAAAPVIAQAQSMSSDRPTAVAASYHGLDLNNPADADVMLNRIGDAALEACGASSFSVRDYRDAVRRSDCYRAGVSRAVASLDTPAVTDAYRHEAYVNAGAFSERAPTGD